LNDDDDDDDDDDVDIIRVWKSVIKAALDYYELKQIKTWFDEEGSK
jgi:hypothetical protein